MMGKLPKLRGLESLQSRITIGIFLLALLVFWSSVFTLSQTLRHSMEKTISAQQFSTVALLARELDRSIRERLDIVENLAFAFPSEQLTQPAMAQANLERHPLPDSIFNWGMVVLDRQGIAVASIPRDLHRQGVNFIDYPGVRAALEGAGRQITDPLFSEHSQQPVFAMIAPIHDRQQQVTGVVIGVTNLHAPNFLDQIGSVKYGMTGDFLITAPKTRSYVTSSDKSRLLKSGPPRGVNPVYDRYIDGYEGSGQAVSSRGVNELSSSKRIPVTGWLMQSVLPADEAFAPINTMIGQLYIVSSSLTLLLCLLCWWWLRRQFRPLREASGMLDGMRRGEIPRQALPVRKNDEIGMLTAAFNSLQEVIIAEEAKAAEHAANARLRQIVADVPGVVFLYCLHPDGHGSFPFVSDAVRQIYEVSPEDLNENTEIIRKLMHADDRSAFLNSLRESADKMVPWRHEYRICLPDGRTRWLLVRAVPEPGQDGEVRFCGFVADISDVKAMEDELREALAEHKRKDAEIERYRDHLEQLVSERTADLELARADALRLASVKSEFLAKMSHEIRTPLNGVLGMAHIGLHNVEPGTKAHNAFVKIEHSGKLLLGIINDILDFSKIEAGKLQLESTLVDLDNVLDETLELMQAREAAKGLELRLERSPGLPHQCLSDPLRLRQILLNLVANAIKFTPAGSVTISAELENGCLCFRIRDTGIGIQPDYLDKIFNPFEQGDNSMTRRFGGTGLGLPITAHLVQLLGGSIEVDSTPDQGSCFTVRLPYLPVAEAQAARLPEMASEQRTSRRLEGLRILVAEDIDINRMVLAELLGDEGATVSFAEDGEQAVRAIREQGPQACDIVLMDVQMPVMNGLEATQRILELAPGLPVIGQTAHALSEEREACQASGMVDHIAKPLDPELLIASILKHARRQGESAACK